MSVERRYNKRYSINSQVYIRYRKQQVFPAMGVNLSAQGMFLQTTNLTMLSGAVVELDLFHRGSYWTVSGIVTHIQHDGIGVMFWQPQPELCKSVIYGSFEKRQIDNPWKIEVSEAVS